MRARLTREVGIRDHGVENAAFRKAQDNEPKEKQHSGHAQDDALTIHENPLQVSFVLLGADELRQRGGLG
jgi:hypothetical protein